jgi:hypothetical protein
MSRIVEACSIAIASTRSATACFSMAAGSTGSGPLAARLVQRRRARAGSARFPRSCHVPGLRRTNSAGRIPGARDRNKKGRVACDPARGEKRIRQRWP